MRAQDWGCLLASGGATLAIAALVAALPVAGLVMGLLALAGAAVARIASRRRPAPISPALRWTLYLPRGPHSPKSLLRFLAPRPGERILEVGPGPGVHTLSVAETLLPGGSLDAVDVQQPMLDALARRAQAAGLSNLSLCLASAERLPYSDDLFDAALLITVLGEVADPQLALKELARVLKGGGRLIAGEMIADPDYVRLSALGEQAARAGFVFEEKRGPDFAYLARFSLGARAARDQETVP